MELIHFRILKTLKEKGTLAKTAETLHLTQSALSHQIKNLEKRLHTTLWQKQGRLLHLTQAGSYLTEVAESVLATVEAAERHITLLAEGKVGKLTLGIECHACYQWFRPLFQSLLLNWPLLDVEVTSRYRFQAFDALADYRLDALLTSDPMADARLTFQPLFNFELLLIVAQSHALAGQSHFHAEDLQGEIVLTYPVAQERLDLFQKVLRPYNIEAKAHKTVEETDLMLEMVAASRGVCLLPDWLLKQSELDLVGLPFANMPLPKTLYLATRAEDSDLAYIQWLVMQAKQL